MLRIILLIFVVFIIMIDFFRNKDVFPKNNLIHTCYKFVDLNKSSSCFNKQYMWKLDCLNKNLKNIFKHIYFIIFFLLSYFNLAKFKYNKLLRISGKTNCFDILHISANKEDISHLYHLYKTLLNSFWHIFKKEKFLYHFDFQFNCYNYNHYC